MYLLLDSAREVIECFGRRRIEPDDQERRGLIFEEGEERVCETHGERL